MGDAPKRPSDERPDGEPYYIDNECRSCGSELRPSEASVEQGWHDEFECPECQDGIYVDWPADRLEELVDRDAR